MQPKWRKIGYRPAGNKLWSGSFQLCVSTFLWLLKSWYIRAWETIYTAPEISRLKLRKLYSSFLYFLKKLRCLFLMKMFFFSFTGSYQSRCRRIRDIKPSRREAGWLEMAPSHSQKKPSRLATDHWQASHKQVSSTNCVFTLHKMWGVWPKND